MKRLAILLFDDVELLDFAGPLEVFSVAGHLSAEPILEVYTVAENIPIRAVTGLSVNPDFRLDQAPAPDWLLVPGGSGTRQVLKSPALMDWVKAQATEVERLLSVCTGALVLGKIGLLDGRSATTHHENLAELQALAPGCRVVGEQRFVTDGPVVTAAGISAGIDMSLFVVEREFGAPLRRRVQDYMEYASSAYP